ncbi:hypothetical protein [Edaphobacter modestus]|uniref:Uncharacterized protein n=1 Tax=Edaphobacter modestus TaxID=388466 RepID=A0A4Q7YVZ9_9BACT|nr:hypothetical protein [Edaphobacter modestus]RZU41838.1 hypothetical protein BDD14_3375 [Edaphobacter modestus]
MTEFESKVLGDLRVLKSQMDNLLGVGQPGRLIHLEERVERHERSVQRVKGFTTAVGALVTLAHIAIDYFRR